LNTCIEGHQSSHQEIRFVNEGRKRPRRIMGEVVNSENLIFTRVEWCWVTMLPTSPSVKTFCFCCSGGCVSIMVMDEHMVTLYLRVALKNYCFLLFRSLRGGFVSSPASCWMTGSSNSLWWIFIFVKFVVSLFNNTLSCYSIQISLLACLLDADNWSRCNSWTSL